jgi:hypothetical protein
VFHGEKIVESVRSAAPPRRASFSSGYPSSTLIELKPWGSKNMFGKLLDPDLAGPILRAAQGVRSVQTTACEPAGSGGPSPPWWSLLQGCRASESESEGVRRDHAMRRDHLWAPRPQSEWVLPSSKTHAYVPRWRRRAAAVGGGARVYSHIKPEMEHL